VSTDILEYGLWYYDFTHYPGLLRQDNDIDCGHGLGNYCRAIFKNNNLYLYNPSEGNCCQCWQDLPPSSPNFLVNQSTFIDYTIYIPLQENSSRWLFDTESNSTHYYYADAETGLPVADSGDGSDLYWFNNTVVDELDPNVFYLPSSCSRRCDVLAQVPKTLYQFLRHYLLIDINNNNNVKNLNDVFCQFS